MYDRNTFILPFMWQAHCFLEPFLAHQNACDGQGQQKGGYKNSFISQTVHPPSLTHIFPEGGAGGEIKQN
jgi:hypothetical protein